VVIETPVLDDLTTRALAARDGDARTYAKAVHHREYEPYQDAWAEALETRNRTVIVCPPDTYKALDLETQIPTPLGWRRFGDLQVDDEVFDEHGKPTYVVGISSTWEDRTCYEVSFGDGTSIVADADHLWLTRTRKDLDGKLADEKTERRAVAALLRGSTDPRVGTHGPRVRTPSGSVKTTEELFTTVRIQGRGGWNHHVPVTEAVEYQGSHLVIAPYTLGAWLGDGHSANGRITNTDFEVWDSIVRDGYKLSDHELTRTVYGLHPELQELGLLNNKHIPKCYLQASVESRWELLQGLMDTDGSPGKSGCIFVNTNEHLAYGVLELARSLGLVASIHEYEAKLNGTYVGQKWHVTFPTHLEVFRIRRKQQALDRPGPKRQGKPIVAVTSVAPRPVRCISVSNPSGLFLAGRGFTPTHNSTTVRDFVEREIGKNPNVRVLWIMNTGEQAQKQVMAISQTIQSNNVYRAAFDVEEDTEAQWTKNVLFVRRSIEDPDPTLMGTGLNGPYQGLHFNIIIIDDPTDQDDVKSPTTMASQVEKIRGVILDRLMEDGRIVVILTRWGQNDLVSTFKEMGFTIYEMPIAGPYPWGPTLSPTKFPLEKIERIHRDKGDILFALTFMCNPQAVKGNIILRDHLQYWNEALIPKNPMQFVMGIDPAASTATYADYCLAFGTRVLRSDLSWVCIEDLEKGDSLVGVDEYAPKHHRRMLVNTPVLASTKVRQPTYRISFADGRSVVSSSQHRWLTRVSARYGGGYSLDWATPHSLEWVETFELKVGTQIRNLCPSVWDYDESREAGYIDGFIDGEGYLGQVSIGIGQNPGETIDKVVAVLEDIGFAPVRHGNGNGRLEKWGVTSNLADTMRFLGTVRPTRLLEGFNLENHSLPLGAHYADEAYATITDIEFIGEQELIGIQTESRTFIAEGLVSHNSAIATVGIDLRTKWMYLVDMWAAKVETPDLEAKIVTLSKRTAGLRAVGLETAGFQLSLLQGMRRRHQLPFREIPYRTRRNVQMKILGLDRDKTGRALYLDSLFASGRLFIPKDLPLVDGVSLEDELCSFSPTGSHRHDDRLDALAIACVMAESLAGSPMLEVSLRGF